MQINVLKFSFFVAILSIGSSGQSQDSKDIIVEIRPLSEKEADGLGKLSPDLYLTKLSGGTLVGSTSENAIILEGAKSESLGQLASSRALKSLTSERPKQFNPIDRLRLSYLPGKKPTQAQLKQLGCELIEDYAVGSFLIVRPTTPIASTLLKSLENADSVSFVAPIKKVRAIDPRKSNASKIVPKSRALATPNDPRLSELWGMTSIRAEKAWDCVKSGQTLVAVIDTGVDYNHEDLADCMWRNSLEASDGIDNDGNGFVDDIFGADFVNNDGDPLDDQSHGSHCAGTVAGAGNNSIGVVGVNWKSPVMALKWLDNAGFGSSVEAIKCIDYAVAHGAKVLSNSWWHPHDPELKEAIIRARDAGVLFVVAAGNFNLDNDDESNYYRYPASYDVDNILAVMAIDASEIKADFSSFGITSVDIAAPGVSVLSSIPGNQYAYFDGTSMATPHVAGAAALILNSPKYGSISLSELKALIMNNARPISALAGKCVTGGALDISFLQQSCSSTEPTKNSCCPVITNGIVSFGTTATQNAKITSTTITLEQDSVVHLTGNCSVKSNQQFSLTVSNGFYNQDVPADPSTDEMWFASLRFVTIPSGEWTNFGSTASISLPKGTHTIYWKVWVTAATLEFDSGTLLVEAFPQNAPTLAAKSPGLKVSKASERIAVTSSASDQELCCSEAGEALLALISRTEESEKLRIIAIQTATNRALSSASFCKDLGPVLSKVIENGKDLESVRIEAIEAIARLSFVNRNE